ncbi:LysR family transcriptional regulator [Candidatus Bipolaricaulota bacterium]
MEFRHLRYFLAVAEELHFSRAAARLAIKQPPLSRQIKNLESKLGVTLFNRTNRRVELTPAGRYLKEAASTVLLQSDQIKNTIRLIQEGTGGFVRIGYVGSAMHSVLPALLRDLRERYPDIHPELFELDNGSQVRAIKSGELDIGFVRTPISAEGLVTRTLLEETFSLVLASSHRLAHSPEIDLQLLADEPFIGFCRDCAPGMADQILQICNAAGFSPLAVHSTTQINALLRLVEIGLGYSIVPSSVRAGYDLNLRFIELIDVPQRAQLSAIYNPQHLAGTALTLMSLVEHAGEGGE